MITHSYPVKCARCGAVIGTREEYTYGGEYGEDRTDYGEINPGDWYGGEYDGDEYCDECYSELVTAEECLP
jgi:hypothetical protein